MLLSWVSGFVLGSGATDASTVGVRMERRWRRPTQCGSMATSVGKDGRPLLVIAQPGATYVTLDADLNLITATAPLPPGVGSFRGGPSTELVCLPSAGAKDDRRCTAVAAVDGATRDAGASCQHQGDP